MNKEARRRIRIVIDIEVFDEEVLSALHYAQWAANIVRGQQGVMQVLQADGTEVYE